jgi:excisionase family DNA binding protein
MSLKEATPPTEALEVPYPPRRCFNIYSAAQYCSCRCAAIEQAIHDGKLKAIRIGRGYSITRESLDKYIDDCEAVEPRIPPSIVARRAARAVNATPALRPKKRLRDERKESQRRAEAGGQSVRQNSQ